METMAEQRRARDSVGLVVGAGSPVGADVSGVVLDILATGDALALAALVEALLVAARVLARVRQTVDAADAHRCLQQRHRAASLSTTIELQEASTPTSAKAHTGTDYCAS